MTRKRLASIAVAASLVALLVLTASSTGAMRSKKLSASLCETTGGGRIVGIPGFPGERIDRRLLADIKYLRKRYGIFVTDGYSNDGVHAYNGEHPMGLALDIAPDPGRGGSWRSITRLAKAAEPRQNQPVAPFRWVGYNGDSGHGRGHHLHLSWNHSETKPGRIARTVYTMRCPGKGDDGRGKGGSGGKGRGKRGRHKGKESRGHRSRGDRARRDPATSGGVGGTARPEKTRNGRRKGKRGDGQSSGGIVARARTTRGAANSGGVGTSHLRGNARSLFSQVDPVIETGGVDAR